MSPMSPSQQKVLHDMVACRTAQLGGHAERCPPCGCERYAYHSCRNRHCPTCQTFTKAQWLEDRNAALLPVPSFHLVFPLPHELNPLILVHTRPLLTLFFAAASQTLGQFGQQNLGGQIGCTLVLHTWDQTLGGHCHVHCVIAAGALSADGARWIDANPHCLFPVRALSTVLRGTCLDALSQRCTTGALRGPEGPADRDTPAGVAPRTTHLRDKDWVVSAKKPFAGPEQVLDSVGRSTHRVAISKNRLVDVQDAQVRCTSRNRRQGDRVQTMTLEAHAWLRRVLLHVFPHGCMRLRHIGFLANRCKAQALRRCRELLGPPPDPPARRVKRVAEWMGQLTGTDITRGPECGYGPLLRLPLPPLPYSHPTPPPIWDSS